MLFFSFRFFPFFHLHPFFFLLSLFLYFLPAYLARKKPDFTSILLLNLLAGWTFIGWIIALIWALTAKPQAQVPAHPPANPPQSAAGSYFCTACGQPRPAGTRFCSACGAAQPAPQR